MKKIIICLLMTVTVLNIRINIAKADWVYENGEMVLTLDSYTEDGKIKVYSLFERQFPNVVLNMELPKVDISLPTLEFMGADNKYVNGTLIYLNRDKITSGFFNLQWEFTPYDSKYETINGYLRYEVFPEDSEKSKGKIIPDIEITNEPTNPSLTSTNILLDTKTTYDINLNSKVSGSTYFWSTVDTDIIEVNSKNGKVKAKKEGKATVACEITLPDGNVNTLESLVTVGYDENAPLLTETILDLEVGNKFDINLENKVQKSKYRWTSSNRDIVKVNSSNGKVTANGIGEAYVTCTITTPENQVIVLKCDINVTELEIIAE